MAQPYFAEATDKLYLREISSSEWAKRTSEMANTKASITTDASVVTAIRTNARGTDKRACIARRKRVYN